MAAGIAEEAAQVGKSITPRRNNAARLFGYDMFISFALGAPPRGTHSYASDLARRLRERDITVFFSEDEAAPGEHLDSVLLKALHRSRALVVIANRATLEEPRWVRKEVEAFRRRYADRPIIPINVDGALQDAALIAKTQKWLQFGDKIWLEESHDAVANGIAGNELVERLASAPAGHSSNAKWRWLVRGTVAALTVLTVAAVGFGIYARKQTNYAQEQARIAVANAEEARRQEGRAVKNANDANDRRLEAEEQRNYATWQGLLREANHHLDDGNEELAALLSRQALLFYSSTPSRPKLAIEESLLRISELPYFAGKLQSGLSKASEISSVAFSHDGTRLAAGSHIEDDAIRVWDLLRPANPPLVLNGHAKGVKSLAFCSDDVHLASSNEDGTIRLWNLRRPNVAPLALKGNGGVAFSPDGTRLATGGKVWDMRQLSAPPLVVREESTLASTGNMALSRDGARLATADGDLIRIWDLRDPLAEPLVLRGQVGNYPPVNSMDFSPNGTHLASGGDDGKVRIWDLLRPNIPPQILAGHDQRVKAVAFSPDGARLASASGDQTIRLWNVGAPKSEPLILKGHNYEVSSVAFSPDGTHLASGGQDRTVRLWDLRQPSAPFVVIEADDRRVSSIALSPDGMRLASGSEGKVIRLWDLRQPKPQPLFLSGHEADVLTVAFSPLGTHLASGGEDKTIRLWDLDRPGSPPKVFSGHEDAVVAVGFSPQGTLLASASRDKTIRLWNLDRPKATTLVLTRQRTMNNAVAFSPDGTHLASAGDDGKVRVWNLAEPNIKPRIFTGYEDPVTAVSFSPDGRYLASGGADSTIRVWDLDRRQPGPALIFKDESNETIYFVAFSSDGSLLVSASTQDDGGIRLWDMNQPNAPPLVVGGNPGPEGPVALSFDGTRLAANDNGTIEIWNLWTRSAEHLCSMITHNLSIDEWHLYVGEGIPYQLTCPSFPPGGGASKEEKAQGQ